MKQRDYNTGDTCTVIAQAQSGYRFVNWTENGEVVSTNARYSFTVTESRDLIANFEQETVPSYTITVTATPNAGGTVTGGGSYTRGSSCTLTATPNEGYNFVKWTKGSSTASVSTNPTYTFSVTGAATYKANFAADVVNYEVVTRSDPSSGGTTTGGGIFRDGESCTIRATANTGYAFVEWQDGTTHTRVSTNSEYTFTVDGNKSYVAIFEVTTPRYTVTTRKSYTGTLDYEGDDIGTVSGGGQYESGNSCTISATPNTNNGFIFVGWSIEPQIPVDPSASTITFNVTRDMVCTANFKPQYDLSISVDGTGGSVRGNYLGSNRYALIARADDGYTFDGWYNGGLSSETALSTNADWSFDITTLSSRPPTSIVARFTRN